MRRAGVAALGLGLAAGLASGLPAGQAQVTLFGAARVSQPWLAVTDDARTAALGDAVVTMPEGNASLQSNPAGLNSILDPELAFAHNEWDSELGLREENLSFGHRLGDGAAAAQVRYFSFGTFDNRDAGGALLDSTTDNALAGSLGYAQGFMLDALELGAEVGGSQESLGGSQSMLVTGGLGLQYLGPLGLRLGASATGLKLSGNADGDAPGLLRLGLGWASRRRAVRLDGEWTRPQDGDGALRVGAEVTLAGTYSLRAGWRFAQGQGALQDAGPSFGGGLRFGELRLDYAYVPSADFGATQRLGATLYLTDGLFGSKIVIETAGNSEAAQAEYNDGLAAYKKKDWYEARVSFKHVLKLQPNFAKAGEITQTLEDLERKIAALKASGNSGEMKEMFAKKVQEARQLYQAGDLVPARKKLEEIFDYDPNLKEAVELRRQLELTMGKKVRTLKDEALQALQDGDLVTAVGRYRTVLKLDEDDQESRARLTKLRPRILDEVTRLHREGIDDYVGGDPQKAIILWQRALDLDPADPRNIRRDMDKARKLLELRASR